MLCLHTVRKGKYVRSIRHMMRQQGEDGDSAARSSSADVVLAAGAGYLIAHSWADLQLHGFWVNGHHLATVTVPFRYSAPPLFVIFAWMQQISIETLLFSCSMANAIGDQSFSSSHHFPQFSFHFLRSYSSCSSYPPLPAFYFRDVVYCPTLICISYI